MTRRQVRIVAVSSPNGGTGKTSLAVNVGLSASLSGLRVAVVDTAIQSPGVAGLLGVTARRSLADYLRGDCDIVQTAHHLPPETADGEGALFVVVACRGRQDAAGALIGGYDPGLLVEGCRQLVEFLDLDLLLLDTPSGLTTEAIVCTGMADINLHVTRARRHLSSFGEAMGGLPASSHLVINMVPEALSEPEVARAAKAFHGNVPLVVLPYVPAFAAAATSDVFVFTHPRHEVSRRIGLIARTLTGHVVK